MKKKSEWRSSAAQRINKQKKKCIRHHQASINLRININVKINKSINQL